MKNLLFLILVLFIPLKLAGGISNEDVILSSQEDNTIPSHYVFNGVLKPFKTNSNWLLEVVVPEKKSINNGSFLFISMNNVLNASTSEETAEYVSDLKIDLSAFLPEVLFVYEQYENKPNQLVFGPFINERFAQIILKLVLKKRALKNNTNAKIVFRSYESSPPPALAVFSLNGKFYQLQEGDSFLDQKLILMKVNNNSALFFNDAQSENNLFSVLVGDVLK